MSVSQVKKANPVPPGHITVRISGLKNKSASDSDPAFSSTLTLPSSTPVCSIRNELLLKHPDIQSRHFFRFANENDAISERWEDVFSSPVQVTNDASCYVAADGYKINQNQTLADFFSHTFPRPIVTKMDQYSKGSQTTAIPKSAESVVVGTGGPDDMTISFMRTIRMPENEKDYPLPPGLGKFPLFDIQSFRSRLPSEIVSQGGLFLPMYREFVLDFIALSIPRGSQIFGLLLLTLPICRT